jgi:2,4-dienoyl-CoA reductase-like NADH-dependent reductase (Old Yellow Enzyme family)/thioredoxin reductase
VKLFEPVRLGDLELKNRIIMPPMGTGLADRQGFVTDRLIDYYARRARGGVGAISIEATIITEETAGVGPETRIHGPEFVPGLAGLVDAVHVHDVPVGIQLWHPGRQTKLGKPIAPSPIPIARRGPEPYVLTLEDIDEVMVKYAEGARHAREAGFDFVEVHGAHCYLPCEFLSPLSNVRDDEYGGSLANRARFMRRIARSNRAEVGDDYPFVYRISGTEAHEGGFTIEDAVQVAVWLEEDGVDCISVSAGNWHALHYTIPPMFMERGCLVPYAEQVRSAVGVPVIAAGRLDDPHFAESVLQEGRAELGRGLIADPDWPEKVRTGRLGEIRPCIACNACVDLVSNAEEARCAVNPALGREGSWRIEPAPVARQVMVVGGGPAGMEAARIARLRGHDVTLWERSDELGGKLDVAGRAPSKEPVGLFRDYQRRVLRELGVEVQTGFEVTPETVTEMSPDVLIVATGASPLVPPIPGIHGANVVDAQAVLLGEVSIDPGQRIAIIGGSATGVETAEFLMSVASEITILEMLPTVGRGVELITRKRLYRELLDGGVRIATGCRVTMIQPTRVLFEREDGSVGRIEVDRVVLAIGWKPTGQEFIEKLDTRSNVIVVGDAAQAGDFVAAINTGADAGLAV